MWTVLLSAFNMTNCTLSSADLRLSFQLKRTRIEQKIAKLQEEIQQLEREPCDDTPGLFIRDHHGLIALLDYLERLKGAAWRIEQLPPLCSDPRFQDLLRRMNFPP